MSKNTSELKKLISGSEFRERLSDIYIDSALGKTQTERYIEAVETFESIFGKCEAEIFSAPGRTEVSGNHTDHQRGCVLAAAVNLDIIAVVHRSDDKLIRIKSDGYPLIEVELNDLNIHKELFGTSESIVRGIAADLKSLGYKTGGFDAYMTSEVLSGSGMSSSAAFEVIIGKIFSELFNDGNISDVLIAKAGQYAENHYFGKPCGLMDQIACVVGGLVYIDFKDIRDPVIEKTEIQFEKFGYSLCISDTKGSHADLTEDYASITKEMKQAAGYFGKEVLREVDPEMLVSDASEIRKEFGDRVLLRALHFFEENKRPEQCIRCLKENDFNGFLNVINNSGISSFEYLQNAYSVKNVKEQGLSVGLAISNIVLKGKGALRVHGGGFAGTIQAFVPNDMLSEYEAAINSVFGTGSCKTLKIRKYGVIKVI